MSAPRTWHDNPEAVKRAREADAIRDAEIARTRERAAIVLAAGLLYFAIVAVVALVSVWPLIVANALDITLTVSFFAAVFAVSWGMAHL